MTDTRNWRESVYKPPVNGEYSVKFKTKKGGAESLFVYKDGVWSDGIFEDLTQYVTHWTEYEPVRDEFTDYRLVDLVPEFDFEVVELATRNAPSDVIVYYMHLGRPSVKSLENFACRIREANKVRERIAQALLDEAKTRKENAL